MSLQEKLFQLIDKEKDIIPLLKSLDIKQKREIVPYILEKKDELYKRKSIIKKIANGTSYSSKYIYTEKKRNLIARAAFICITTKTEFRKHIHAKMVLEDNYHTDILPWYVPKWLDETISESWAWNYDLIIEYQRKGYCIVAEGLVASRLSNFITTSIWDQKRKKHITTYHPNKLFIYPETLKSHIWLLFENNSSVNHEAKYQHFTNYEEKEDVWKFTLKNLINEGHLDRLTVIKKCIQTQEKEVSNAIVIWFYKLLVELKPTKNELLEVQDELLITLNSETTKVLSTSLRLIKSIAQDTSFNKEEMVSFSSLLLISNAKAIVNSTLMIFEKILKTNPEYTEQILNSLCDVFINQDSKIQTRAAKIIAKYSDAGNLDIKSKLNEISELITFDAKNLLANYIEEEDAREEEINEENTQNSLQNQSQQNELPKYDTFDSILFLLSQSLDNNEPYNLELSISLMPKFFTLINDENINKLEPFFKRAINHTFKSGSWTSRSGYLEVMYSNFINDLFNIVSKKYSSKFFTLSDYKKELIKEQYSNKWTYEIAQFRSQKIENQALLSKIFTTHHNFLIKSKNLIANGSSLPLISQITHTPCWINPVILLKRILKYENENTPINSYDLCTALLRLSHLYKNSEIVDLIGRIKNSHLVAIFNYLFDIRKISDSEFKKNKFSFIAALAKDDVGKISTQVKSPHKVYGIEQGSYKWGTAKVKYKDHKYNYEKRGYDSVIKEKTILKLENVLTSKSIVSGVKNKWNKFFFTESNIIEYFDTFQVRKRKWESLIDAHDETKFFFLSPRQPSAFLTLLIQNNLKEPNFSGETEKKNIINTLKALNQIWTRKNYDHITYLFVGATMVCSDRIARELSAELWINGNAMKTFDNERLGVILGELYNKGYVPLKRLTDLISNTMINIDKKTNKALFIVLTNMIPLIKESKPRNSKKLLEIIHELRHKNGSPQFQHEFIQVIQSWRETKSLVPLIKKLSS